MSAVIRWLDAVVLGAERTFACLRGLLTIDLRRMRKYPASWPIFPAMRTPDSTCRASFPATGGIFSAVRAKSSEVRVICSKARALLSARRVHLLGAPSYLVGRSNIFLDVRSFFLGSPSKELGSPSFFFGVPSSPARCAELFARPARLFLGVRSFSPVRQATGSAHRAFSAAVAGLAWAVGGQPSRTKSTNARSGDGRCRRPE